MRYFLTAIPVLFGFLAGALVVGPAQAQELRITNEAGTVISLDRSFDPASTNPYRATAVPVDTMNVRLRVTNIPSQHLEAIHRTSVGAQGRVFASDAPSFPSSTFLTQDISRPPLPTGDPDPSQPGRVDFNVSFASGFDTYRIQFGFGGTSGTIYEIRLIKERRPNNRPVSRVDQIPDQSIDFCGAPLSLDMTDPERFTDPDSSDTLFYLTNSDPPGIVGHNAGNPVVFTPQAVGTTMVTIQARDRSSTSQPGVTTAQHVFGITVNPGPLTVTASGTYRVSETASRNTNVGAALTACGFSSDGTWSIVGGNTGRAFSISNAGQIQVARELDHETVPRYTLTIRHARGSEQRTVPVTVTVSDVNEAPVARGAIRAIFATAGGDAVVRDVSRNFRDPEEGPLTYSADSSNRNVATASVNGSEVSIRPIADGSATVTITARDSSGLTATQTVRVTVTDGPVPNEGPRASGSIAPVTATVGAAAVIRDVSGYFVDPNGDELTYTAAAPDNTVVTVSVDGSEVSITPVAAGVTTVTVTASDPAGEMATQTISVTITDAPVSNAAPMAIGSIAAVSAAVDADAVTVDVSGRFFDPDDDELTYTAASGDAAIVTTSVTPAGLVSITPVALGVATITVTASDPGGLTATQMFDVTITEAAVPNEAPMATGPIAPVTAAVDAAAAIVDVSGNFVDPNGDELTYTAASDAAAVVTVSVDGSEVSITPVAVGMATVTVIASDPGGLMATQTIDVTITAEPAPNEAPVATDPIAAVVAAVTGAAVVVDLSGNFDDPDGDELTYMAATDNMAVVTVSVDGSEVSITPVAVGTATVTVTASDPGGEMATQTISVTIHDGSPTNQAPVVSGAIEAVFATIGTPSAIRNVAGNFRDPDGDALTFTVASSDVSVATTSVTSAGLVSITQVAVGTATITVTASDPGGLTATLTISVTVNDGTAPTNRAPVASGAIDAVITTVSAASTTRNVARNFRDPDGDSLTYAAVSNDLAVATVAVRGSAVSITPVGAGRTTVTVTASDPGGLRTSLIISVTVNDGTSPTNRSPVASGAINPVTTTIGAASTTRNVAGNFRDPDGDSLTYAARSNDMAVATVSVDGSAVRITPAGVGRTTITVTANDSGGLMATQRIEVTVRSADDAGVPTPLSGLDQEVLPHVAQAMVSGSLAAITGRIESAASGGLRSQASNLAGKSTLLQALKSSEQAFGDGTLDLERALGGSSFVVSLNATEDDGASGAFAVWGAADYRNLSGPDDSTVDWDGDLFSFQLGADLRVRHDLLAGVAVAQSSGSYDYADRANVGAATTGTYDARMISVQPYLSWSPSQDTALWAALGYGQGEIEIDDASSASGSSDTEMQTVAVGASHRLLSDDGLIPGGVASLRLKGEGSTARIEVDGRNSIPAASFDVQRLRVSLEGRYECADGSSGCLSPSVEAGVRQDGGDGTTGTGVELGASLRYANPASGLTLEGRGRVLVAGQEGSEDWGVGGLIRVDPGADRLGVSFSLTPSLGDSASKVERLYNEELPKAAAAAPSARLNTEIGYGFTGMNGVVTPYAAASLTDAGSETHRLGVRFDLGSSLRLSLEGARRQSEAAATGHDVMLRGRLRW